MAKQKKQLKHIAVAGNIGSGKTTLTEKLAKHYNWEARYEDVENNPAYINKIAKDGAEKARISSRNTLDGVQEIMGLKSIWK